MLNEALNEGNDNLAFLKINVSFWVQTTVAYKLTSLMPHLLTSGSQTFRKFGRNLPVINFIVSVINDIATAPGKKHPDVSEHAQNSL